MPVLVASSNQGKLREYIELSRGAGPTFRLLPDFDSLPPFEEGAPTFAENAAGKALHYSRFADDILLADDSGLVVPALGGAPGVYSARYAGPDATDADRFRKLLNEMSGLKGGDRRARFVCATAVARRGRALAIVSDFVEGAIALEPRGENGFGYDPVFELPGSGRTFAELKSEGKNQYSHRGRAFKRMFEFLIARNF
jgi:XTP/dITP diphosphohydrolase